MNTTVLTAIAARANPTAVRRSRERVAALPRSESLAARLALRSAAMGIDVALYVLVTPFTLGVAALALQSWWPLAALGIALAYYTVGTASGQTLGMHLMGVRVVSLRTGRPPGWKASVLRSTLVILPVAGLFSVLTAVVPGDTSATGPAAPSAAYLIVGVAAIATGLVDRTAMLIDSRRRPLHNRLFCVATVSAATTARSGRQVLRMREV